MPTDGWHNAFSIDHVEIAACVSGASSIIHAGISAGYILNLQFTLKVAGFATLVEVARSLLFFSFEFETFKACVSGCFLPTVRDSLCCHSFRHGRSAVCESGE